MSTLGLVIPSLIRLHSTDFFLPEGVVIWIFIVVSE